MPKSDEHSAQQEPTRLYRVTPDAVDPATAQTAGMVRVAAISGASVGSSQLWMGQTHVAPGAVSANHHHGASETAIYVVSGSPVFVYSDGVAADGRPREVRVETRAGDYVFVPPFVPHREENPDPDREAVVVIARSTQEAIVVNLDSL